MKVKPYLLALLVLFLFSAYAANQSSAAGKKVKIDEDVIELEVSPAMREKIQKALQRGKMYEENGVTIVELDEKDQKGVLNEGDDAIVLAPPENRSNKDALSETLKCAVAIAGSDKDVTTRLAQGGALVMSKAFLAVLPLAVRVGYGLDLVKEGVTRKFMRRPQRTAAEREKLWQEYVKWEMELQASGRSLQYMVFEYDEYVEGKAPEKNKKSASEETPRPAVVQQTPMVVQQAPVVVQQSPVIVQQAPVVVQQSPVVVQQSPVVVQQPEEMIPEGPAVAEAPQQIVAVNQVVRTSYSGGKRHVRMERPGFRRPKGHHVRHRVHYLPGLRRAHHQKSGGARPVVIRRARHAHGQASLQRRAPSRRTKVVMHTKSYRSPKKAVRGKKRP